jgi:hypothetical protein
VLVPGSEPVPGGGVDGGFDGGVDGGVDGGFDVGVDGGFKGGFDVGPAAVGCGALPALPQPESTRQAARASAATPRSFGGVQKLCKGLPSTNFDFKKSFD